MRLQDLFSWPPRCNACGAAIDEWTRAGFSANRWLHKACWPDGASPREERAIASPADGVRLGLPMILFLLIFHVGGGAAVFGWFSMTQAQRSGVDSTAAAASLLAGLTMLLVGIGGFVLEIVIRARREAIDQALKREGGWRSPEAG